MPFRFFSSGFAIAAQLALVLGGFLLLRAQPPAQGNMLLVPMAGQSRSELANFAVGNGLTIVTAGDWTESLVVRGERNRLGWALASEGVLVLATAIEGCTTA